MSKFVQEKTGEFVNMNIKRKNRYTDKIASLEKYYGLLNSWIKNFDLNIELKNPNYQHIFAIYHATQLCIEVITDLCAMIIKDSQYTPKDDYTNFKFLNDRGIISNELFQALKELNGLRNRIVHYYNGIIDEIALQSINRNFHNMEKIKDVFESWLKDK